MAGFGVSFVPGQGQDQQPSRPGGLSPAQQAVQLLSLRLPRVGGAQGIAPGPLLNAPGAMGMPGADLNGAAANPLLQALLRLAGLGNGPGPMSAPGGPGTPRVIPGGDAPQPGPGSATYPGVPPGSPTYDRSQPPLGNRLGGPALNTSGTQLPPEFTPPPGRRGPLNREY